MNSERARLIVAEGSSIDYFALIIHKAVKKGFSWMKTGSTSAVLQPTGYFAHWFSRFSFFFFFFFKRLTSLLTHLLVAPRAILFFLFFFFSRSSEKLAQRKSYDAAVGEYPLLFTVDAATIASRESQQSDRAEISPLFQILSAETKGERKRNEKNIRPKPGSIPGCSIIPF